MNQKQQKTAQKQAKPKATGVPPAGTTTVAKAAPDAVAGAGGGVLDADEEK